MRLQYLIPKNEACLSDLIGSFRFQWAFRDVSGCGEAPALVQRHALRLICPAEQQTARFENNAAEALPVLKLSTSPYTAEREFAWSRI